MGKNSHSKILPILTSVWVGLIMVLGVWWLYLLMHIGSGETTILKPNMAKLVLWEGSSFIILLVLVSWTISFLYFKDRKKSKAMSAFFASMTHELKTPLASIRLQAEVIDETIKSIDHERLKTVVNRLMNDTLKLENQMDKILQLSRMESGGGLHLTQAHLIEHIHLAFKRWAPKLNYSIKHDESVNDLAFFDEFAFELIMRNLIENTIVHSKSEHVQLSLADKEGTLELIYHDNGQFTGERDKLGQLFYKHQSIRGSGIGLYLIQGLMKQMGGIFSIEGSTSLSFSLRFKKGGDHE